MTQTFDCDIASICGIGAAVLFQNFCSAIEQNHNGTVKTENGKCWVRALAQGHPYMSNHAIRTALEKLLDAGLIEAKHLSDSHFDRTTWYAITNFGYALFAGTRERKEETEVN